MELSARDTWQFVMSDSYGSHLNWAPPSNGDWPLVTIAIPTFNRAKSLKRAVESALAQDYPSIEIIISDNASTDATEKYCRGLEGKDRRIRYFRQLRNVGITENFRATLRYACGEFFMWLADDDWIELGYVSCGVKRLLHCSNTVLSCGSAVLHLSEGKLHKGTVVNALSSIPFLRVLWYLAIVRDNSCFYGLYRRRALEKTNLRNVLAADWLVVAGMALLGKVYTDETISIHRAVDGVSSSVDKITKALGLSHRRTYFPTLAISVEIFLEIVSNDRMFGTLGVLQRSALAVTSAGTVLIFQGVVWKAWVLSSRMLTMSLGEARASLLRQWLRRVIGV